MNLYCPQKLCQNPSSIVKDGFFKRNCDAKRIQRYRCKRCGLRFSRATFRDDYRLKHRRHLKMIEHLLCSKVSMRRIARILKLNRKTIASRLDLLADRARKKHKRMLDQLKQTKVKKMQFDDLITTEHTKMKPLSISIAVDKDRRTILGAEVARIPAFGHLAKRSRKKYGFRPNEHEQGLKRLFEKIYKSIDKDAIIQSDMHKAYPKFVSKYLQYCTYKTYEGGRSCVSGQGELKKKGFDPLFTLNHTCAMLRDSINRLVRKTWCSTKRVDKLQKHLDIFIAYYNFEYLGLELNTT